MRTVLNNVSGFRVLTRPVISGVDLASAVKMFSCFKTTELSMESRPESQILAIVHQKGRIERREP
jgi:hypothetical protein